MSYDRRILVGNSLKMTWRKESDKKYEMSSTRMWAARVVRRNKADPYWHPEINFSGPTFFVPDGESDFGTPEEAMAAAEEGIRQYLKRELAHFT